MFVHELAYDDLTLPKRIGELLVEGGVLSQSQLEQALFAQRKDGRKLGQLLIELGLASEVQLTQTLSRQLSVPWVSLYHVDFSRSLLNLVSREIAERYSVVPILVRRVRNQGETLYVAMDDPTNETAIEEVARTSALRVKPMIACPSDIHAAIRVYYIGDVASTSGSSGAGLQAVGPRAVDRTAPERAPERTVERQPPERPVERPSPLKPGAQSAPVERPPTAPVERLPVKVLPRREPATSAPAPSPEPPADERDSADSSPDIQAHVEEIVPPKRRGKMISLTLLDGTTIAVPAPKKQPSQPDADPRPREELSDQLTARDLVSALRAVAHGVDASEILGVEPRWEALFSALLSILLRRGLIADWEFIEEFRKI